MAVQQSADGHPQPRSRSTSARCSTSKPAPRSPHHVSPARGLAGDEGRQIVDLRGPRSRQLPGDREPGAQGLRASLYAPLPVLLYEDDRGRAVFEDDQPSSLFGQFGVDQVTAVARALDDELNAVLLRAAG
jgi:hypothetical protein